VFTLLWLQSTPLGSLHASGDTGLSPGQLQQRATMQDDDRNRGALLNKVIFTVHVMCLLSVLFSVISHMLLDD